MNGKTMPEVTAENYYSPEMARKYYSVSQIKAFMDCESAAVAEIKGEHVREKTPALLVGGYIDAYFAWEMDEYREAHPEIFKKGGMLKSEFVQAEQIIERIEQDTLAIDMMTGEAQKIVTGKIAGYPFKAKLDFWLMDECCEDIADRWPGMDMLRGQKGAIVDLKIVKDFSPMYREGEGRMHFIEYWRYDLQMSIYQELMRQQVGEKVPCFILAATKQDPPDIQLYQIPQEWMDFQMEQLKKMLPDIDEAKQGRRIQDQCGKCAWCRQIKVLREPVMPEVLE